jgi:hypothetical protein
VAIAMLSLSQEALVAANNSAEIFNILSALPSKVKSNRTQFGISLHLPRYLPLFLLEFDVLKILSTRYRSFCSCAELSA